MALLLFWNVPAVAQPSDKATSLGSVVANTYSRIPDGSAILIEFREDTELNARVRPVLQEELLDRGHKVSSDAPLVLQISLEVETSAPPESRIGLSGQGDNRGLSDAKVTIKVDRNAKNQTKKTRYRLEASLIDQKNKPVWKGTAGITVGAGRDRAEVAEMIVRALMAEFGSSVRAKPIIE
jgi:hypothetical protein